MTRPTPMNIFARSDRPANDNRPDNPDIMRRSVRWGAGIFAMLGAIGGGLYWLCKTMIPSNKKQNDPRSQKDTPTGSTHHNRRSTRS